MVPSPFDTVPPEWVTTTKQVLPAPGPHAPPHPDPGALMKTCDKLGVSFWDYLGSRLDIPGAPPILPLPDLIRQRAAA